MTEGASVVSNYAPVSTTLLLRLSPDFRSLALNHSHLLQRPGKTDSFSASCDD